MFKVRKRKGIVTITSNSLSMEEIMKEGNKFIRKGYKVVKPVYVSFFGNLKVKLREEK